MIFIEDYEPHDVSELICIKCGKRWIGVRPSSTLLKNIQCPQCEQSGYVIETGQTFSNMPKCYDCRYAKESDDLRIKCRLRIEDKSECQYYERKGQ